MPFDVRSYWADDLPESTLDAVALLTAEAYERDLMANLTGEHPPTTPADLRARLLRAFRRVSAGQAIGVVSAAGRDGSCLTLATARVVHSDRDLPIGDTVGDPASPLPTHKFWCGFRYPTVPGWIAPTMPESAVGEFTQLATVDGTWLAPYVARGVITAEEAETAARGAVFAAIAAVYERDQQLPVPPRAYVFDTRARQVKVLSERFGLHILPLLHDGVTLRPEVLADPLHARTIGRWLAAMAPYAPPDVLAGGMNATIRHLAAQGFTGWRRLPMRLPWVMLNDEQTAAGMRRLARQLPVETALPLAAAD